MFEKNKHYKMKLNIFIIAGIALLSGSNTLFALRSTLTRHDVFPLYSTVDPMDKMLVRKQKLELFDAEWADDKGERFFFSAAPFAQNADRGKPMSGGYFFDFAASCPQAASMSWPRLLRTVAWTPASSSRR